MNTYAVVVGIENYDRGGAWPVHGPCTNAIAIIEWLIAIGTPPENIYAFLEPHPDNRLADEMTGLHGVRVVRSADWPQIDAFFHSQLPKGRPNHSRLFVYWSGHGCTKPATGDRIFFCRDYTDELSNRVFNANTFLRTLGSADYRCFTDQILFADVCGNYPNTPLNDSRVAPALVRRPHQLAYFATPENEYAKGSNGRGAFTDTALRVLRQINGWPDHRRLVEKMSQAFDNDVGQTPFRVEVLDDEHASDRLVAILVYVSYARMDGKDPAHWLYANLQMRGFRAWRDTRSLNEEQDFTTKIESAIERASYITVCITGNLHNDTLARREIQYAISKKKHIIALQFANAPPLNIANVPIVDFVINRERGFERLVELLRQTPQAYNLGVPEDDPFRKHMEDLNEYIVSELRRTVLDVQSILSIKAADSKESVADLTPPAYRTRHLAWFGDFEDQNKEFDSLAAGFAHYGGRLLLLGAPGSGKSTALLAFAREKTVERLSNPHALLPVFCPIRTWDGKKNLMQWLTWCSGFDPGLFQEEFNARRILLFLDGLDELRADSRDDKPRDFRVDFLDMLNDGAQTPTLISCRDKDYEEITRKAKTKLALNGAIILKPLEDHQIQTYLEDQEDLWAALKGDATLRDMARIPLILTLLALAYQDAGDSARQLRNLSLSPSGLRDEIIQSYMRKRYQFEQARLPEGDRLPFSLETIRSLLGEVGATLLDYSQRIRLEVTDNKVTIRSYDEQAAAFVEIHKSAFRNILGPRAHTFTEIAGRLHLLIPSGRDHFRFSHLLLRDHFSFAYCITRLSSRNRQLGRACIGALGLIRDTRAVASLIQVIDDTDRTNSALAIWAIGEIGDPAGIQKLLAAVSHIPGDEGFRVMSMLCEALGKMGEQAIDVLGDLARKPEDFLAPAKAGQEEFSFPLQLITGPQTVRGLSLIGAPAIEKLIELLDDDLLTEDAAEALADMGDRRASEGLINAMEHSSEFARAKVADALGRVKDTAAIPILIAHARDKEPELRQSAIRALGEIADERAIQTLISIMDHPDPVTRLSAVQALGKFEGDEVRKELVKALDDGDLEVRDVAASVLEAQGFCKAMLLEKQAPVSILRATLDSRDSRLRAVAAQALGRCRDVGAVGALNEVLFKDTEEWVRVNAAIALGKIGDPSATGALGIAITSDNAAVRKHAAASLGLLGGTDAVKILISALSDHEESVWREAGTAILTIGEMATEPLVAMLDGSDSQSQQIIEQLLGDMGEPAVSCLVGLLVSEQGADDTTEEEATPLRHQIARILVHLGKVAVDRLIRLLREGQPAVRAVIATILGEVADERATAPLIAALQDEEDVRSSASTALAKIDDAAVPLLLDTLGRVPPEFQREVVRTLGEIGDLRSVEPLINALESKSEEVRVQAAIALGKVGVPAAVGPLVLHLQDPETVGVRHRATWALGAIGQPAAIEPLVSCLDDPDIRVRGTAVESLVSLKYIGPDLERRRPTVEELMAAWRSEDEDLVEYAVDALNKAGELAVWPLILALTEPNSRIRSMAVVQLGSMQDKRAVQPLIDRLRTDTDATVRCLTAVMLSEWKDERVNQSLVEALSDKEEDVSSAAYLSLVKIGESAVEPLIAALYQSNKSIQLYAVSALGGIGDERAIRPVGELLIKRGDLRQEAALALEGIGAPAVDFLIASLSDEDPEVRGLAMSSLLNIGGPAIDPLIATWREPKYIELAPYSMDVLIRFGQIAISPLTTALQNKSDAVSMRAARVLVEIGEPAIPLLISILRDKFLRARLKVAATLAEISGELAQKAVEAFLETSGAGDRAQVKKIQRKLKKLSKGSRFE